MEKIRKKAEVFSVRKELEESTASENKKEAAVMKTAASALSFIIIIFLR